MFYFFYHTYTSKTKIILEFSSLILFIFFPRLENKLRNYKRIEHNNYNNTKKNKNNSQVFFPNHFFP